MPPDLTPRQERAAERRPVLLGLVVPALVVLGLLVVLGPALLGRGVLLDVDALSSRLPFGALAGSAYGEAITCRKDTIDYFPAIAEIRHALFRGDLPTWAPYEVGGAPLAGLPNAGFLTPLALPYFVLPLWLAPAFVKLAEVVVALAGTVLFLRRRGVSRAGAWLAGFVFATSGFMIMWSNWPQTRVAALIPLFLWAVDRVVARHRARDAVVLALVLAAMLLGGFPAVTLFTLTVAGVYVLVLLWTQHRRRPWDVLGILATAVGGLVLGVGLAAVQIVPFVENLSATLAERDKGGAQLPLGAALTLLNPSARGTCRGGVWFGDVIPIEAVGYLGSAALVLVVLGTGFRRRRREERGTRAWLIGTLVVAGWLIWVGEPLLTGWQQLPVVGNNSVTRAQSVVGFLAACLVGFGFDQLVRTSRAGTAAGSSTPDRAGTEAADGTDGAVHPRSWRPVVVLLAAVLVLLCLTVAAVVDASRDGYLDHLVGSSAAPVLLLLATVAVVVLVHVASPRLATWGPLAVVALVVAQGVVFAQTMLPLSQRELFFPDSTTHRFLQANLGQDRYGAGAGTMDAAISDWYHLRTATGHEFTDPRWKDLLAAVDPEVQRTVTYSAFSSGLPSDRIASSPVLDRLAVRYWTADPRRPIGTAEPVAEQGRVRLGPDDRASCRVDGGPVRGIVLHLTERMPPAAPGTVPELRVRVSAGGQTRTGSVLLDGTALGPGPLRVAVAGEDLPEGGEATVEVALDGTEEPRYLAGEGGSPSCSAVRPDRDTDQLRLVFSDAGSSVYERLGALPRIRWASSTRVVAPDRQVEELVAGVPEDTVLLDSDATPTARGGSGRLSVTRDDAERIGVDTDATEQGHLVLADNLVRPGWAATVDGDPAPIVRADHALAAVPVPAGRHRVELVYTAPGLRAGAVLSASSLLAATGLLVAPALVRRRRRHR